MITSTPQNNRKINSSIVSMDNGNSSKTISLIKNIFQKKEIEMMSFNQVIKVVQRMIIIKMKLLEIVMISCKQ